VGLGVRKTIPGIICSLTILLSPRLVSAQDANAIFDDNVLQDVYLQVDPADWTALQQNYLLNTYYPATLTWNGITETIGIRSHGNGSRSPIKPNLDLKFDEYVKKQTLAGESLIDAKAGNQDASLMHESISFQLFRMMGIPAPRLSHARLYLNGNFFGLYLLEEHEDETYVQRDLGESTGYLYEWDPVALFNFDNLGDPSLYAPFLDLKTNQSAPDLQTFASFMQVVNDSSLSNADYITSISKYISPKLFLAHAATENVLAELDGMFGGVDGINNFYLYQYNNTSLYQVLTWDKDLTFWDASRNLFYGMDVDHITARLINIPEYLAVYLAAESKAITLFGGTGGWADQEITREYNLIHDAAALDVNKQCIQASSGGLAPCGYGDFQAEVTRIHAFTGQRTESVKSQLAYANYQPPPSLPSISAVSLSGPVGSSTLAPGALFTVQGTNLGDSANAQTNPLPRALGQVFVAVDGVRAPLWSSSSGAIVAQVPVDMRVGNVNVDVALNGVVSNNVQVPVATVSPSIILVTHADGTAVSDGNSAIAGETLVIYVTGLGPVSPSIGTGAFASSTVLSNTVNTPGVTIDGTPLNVVFSGLAPGFVGLYQINAQVPMTLTSAVSISVTGAGEVSTVPLRP
jgi:uncharacterized protein (TIGR03437 family)